MMEYHYMDNIYELDHETGEWNNIANLKIATRFHAVSVLSATDLKDLWQYCK